MKIKHIVITLLTIWTCAFAFGQEPTLPDPPTIESTTLDEVSSEISLEKTGFPSRPLRSIRKVTSWYWYFGACVSGGAFLFASKYWYLCLELVSYEKFHSRCNTYARTDANGAITWNSHEYPEINPRSYIFKLKSWRLKQILDPFTYDDWTKWINNQPGSESFKS